jgi:archaemetzincin
MKANFRKLCFVFFIPLLSCSQDDKTKVGIQPLGKIDHLTTSAVYEAIHETFRADVYVLKPLLPPESSFINMKTPRYRADKIIEKFRKEKPDSLDYVIIVTDVDISVTKKDQSGNIKKPESKYQDWGVFGYGYSPGPTCIVSSYRIKKSAGITQQRIKKIAIHELGHNFGLPHCSDENCVMLDAAETIQTIDKVDGTFCQGCKKKIKGKLSGKINY